MAPPYETHLNFLFIFALSSKCGTKLVICAKVKLTCGRRLTIFKQKIATICILYFCYSVVSNHPTYPLRGALDPHLVHPLPLHHPVDAQHAAHLLVAVVPPVDPPHRAEDGPKGGGVETKPYK